MRNCLIAIMLWLACSLQAQERTVRFCLNGKPSFNLLTSDIDYMDVDKDKGVSIVLRSGQTYQYAPMDIDSVTFLDEDGRFSDLPKAFQNKIRSRAYPQRDNELLINPSPLIVPQGVNNGDRVQFQLAMDPSFGSSETVMTSVLRWRMFNPHRLLDTGTWYWRYRTVNESGIPTGWSNTYSFAVMAETPQFVTPAFDKFYANLPTGFPRLYCFLADKIEAGRKQGTSIKEYKQLIEFATTGMNSDDAILALANPYTKASTLKLYVDYIYQAYMITRQQTYADELKLILQKLMTVKLTDRQLFESNFQSTDIVLCLLPVYDLFHDTMSAEAKAYVEEVMIRVLNKYYAENRCYEENHIFDNHFWQQNYRVYVQAALMLYDHPAYRDAIREMLEYYYELWTARAPAGGLNRDGEWVNGPKYFITNTQTLFYIPMLFGYATKADFLRHPWYLHAGKGLTYGWLPKSLSLGFGDGSEWHSEPERQRTAFVDFLARELQDPYAGWYAAQNAKSVSRDPDLRLYRMTDTRSYSTYFPSGSDKYHWYKDMGIVTMHTDMANTANDVSVSFRSSTFGSGSHTLADQNGFYLQYHGKNVFAPGGYYVNFSDKYNLLAYRHTRAHNTILVDGIGQPFSTEGYGMVTRAMGGEHVTYCMGDASKAYQGVSDDQMWIDAFNAAGISQTATYGFGATPLNKFRRHMLLLHPNILVIYDDLGSTEPVRWDWLLHSPVQFGIDAAQATLTTIGSYTAVTHLYNEGPLSISQTNDFYTPLENVDLTKYPKWWHLTASSEKTSSTRFLAIIVLTDAGTTPPQVERQGNEFRIGDWKVFAELRASASAQLSAVNTATGSLFDYGNAERTKYGDIRRKERFSSILSDNSVDGQRVVEAVDVTPVKTR